MQHPEAHPPNAVWSALAHCGQQVQKFSFVCPERACHRGSDTMVLWHEDVQEGCHRRTGMG